MDDYTSITCAIIMHAPKYFYTSTCINCNFVISFTLNLEINKRVLSTLLIPFTYSEKPQFSPDILNHSN